MSKVFFNKNFDKLLEKIDFSKLGKKIAIKCHFGETGCVTYISPTIVKKLYKKVKNKNNIVHLVDCNVLYKGTRTTTTDHLKTAKNHGFTFAPVKILDGEMGQDYVDINGAKIGKGIKDYDSMIVLSHFKGHLETGFGGALKNLGMGLASRAGKLYLHSEIKPSVDKKKCAACNLCVEKCPVNCITMPDKAIIDQEECIGCAMCIAVCPVDAIKIPWMGRTPFKVQEKIADYTKSIISLFKNVIYINGLINITSNCDCMGHCQTPVMDDIGWLYSTDIVSIEHASRELIAKKNKLGFLVQRKLFDHQTGYAEKIKLGKKKFELIE